MADKLVQTSLVDFHSLTLLEAANKITAAAKESAFSYVVTPNVDHLARLIDDESGLGDIYKSALLSLCDSRVIDKMLRLRGKSVVEVVPGSTLTEYLFKNTLTPEDKVLILGVEDQHITKLRSMYSHLNLHHINPSMGFINKPDEVSKLLEDISELQPNYIFLSVGSPRQEVLAQKISQHGKVGGVGLCVGASVLFLVGAEKRAPLFLQKLHLEWVYRMLQEPKRLVARYGKNFLALPAILAKL